MMALRVPMDVRAQIEPVIGDDGQPRLWVRASSTLRINDPFELEGPDGPSPARDTLLFNLDFMMVAGSSS